MEQLKIKPETLQERCFLFDSGGNVHVVVVVPCAQEIDTRYASSARFMQSSSVCLSVHVVDLAYKFCWKMIDWVVDYPPPPPAPLGLVKYNFSGQNLQISCQPICGGVQWFV